MKKGYNDTSSKLRPIRRFSGIHGAKPKRSQRFASDRSRQIRNEEEMGKFGNYFKFSRRSNKNGQGWAKYCTEKKHGLKNQCAQFSASMRRTGGGTADNLPELSALENRLVAVMGGQEFATGGTRLIVNPFPQTTRPTESPVVIEDSLTIRKKSGACLRVWHYLYLHIIQNALALNVKALFIANVFE